VKRMIFLIVVAILLVNQANAAPPQSEAAVRQALENGVWLCDSP
jgi:hypothetical protein